jgi:hypothetical protein
MVPKGNDQWLMLHFDDTLPRTLGKWLSALSILFCLGVLIWDVRIKRRQSGDKAGNEEGQLNAAPDAQV